MTLVDMNATVTEELEHIPRGRMGSEQMLFRSIYSQVRRHDLSQYALPSVRYSLRRAIDICRKTSPDFTPKFDPLYFAGSDDVPESYDSN